VARGSAEQVLVFACDTSEADALRPDGITVIQLPCVGMLPPSFVDFALARGYATGVMIAGCAEGDCQHRLGNEWTRRRMARERDPYLRRRVDDRRVLLSWLPRGARNRRQLALDGFRSKLAKLDDV
jgi:coenzyme F420-reducing hydrogenase delta subunit